MISIFSKIVGAFFNLIGRGAYKGIRHFVVGIENIVAKVFEAFAWAFTGIFLLEVITQVVTKGSPPLMLQLSQLIATQAGDPRLAAIIQGNQGFTQFTSAAEGIGSIFFDKMIDVFRPEGPITPEIGATNARKFVGINVMVNVVSWLTRVMADVLSLGKFESIGGLPLQLSWSLGLGWLTWVIMGPPLQMFIADPMVEGFNAKHTPNKLIIGQVLDIFTEGLKDESWFKSKMLNFGYDEEHALLLYEARRKKFSRQQGKRFFERGLIDEDQLREIIKKEGWTEEELDLIMQELLSERIFDLNEDIAKEAQKLFEDGQISETSARTFLKNAHWQGEEIDLAIQLANMRKLRTDLTPSQMLNMMSKELFTQAQVLQRLKDRGFDDPDAQSLIQYELITQNKGFGGGTVTPEKTLTQAQILNAYRNGIITESDAAGRLTEQGLDSEDVNILLDLNRPTTQ